VADGPPLVRWNVAKKDASVTPNAGPRKRLNYTEEKVAVILLGLER